MGEGVGGGGGAEVEGRFSNMGDELCISYVGQGHCSLSLAWTTCGCIGWGLGGGGGVKKRGGDFLIDIECTVW